MTDIASPSARRLAAAQTGRARLQNQHELFSHAATGRLVWPPLDISTPLNVLDSAGADGTWLRALRSQLPLTNNPGWSLTSDIDPLKFPLPASPSDALKGQGEEYLIHSFLDPWPERLYGKFDLVHQRLGLAASMQTPIVEVIKGFATLLKPGEGWLQLVELDTSPTPEDLTNGKEAMADFKSLIAAVAMAWGVRSHLARGLSDDMIEAGFVRCEGGSIAGALWCYCARGVEGGEYWLGFVL